MSGFDPTDGDSVTISDEGLDKGLLFIGDLLKKNLISNIEENGKVETVEADQRRVGDSRLPHWPLSVYGVPNVLATSALFQPLGRKSARKAYVTEELIPSRPGCSLKYKGVQLSSTDSDVFYELIDYMKEAQRLNGSKLGEPVEITYYELTKRLGREKGGTADKWIDEVTDRLVGGIIKIETKKYSKKIQLLASWGRNKETDKTEFVIHPEIAYLFGNKEFGWVDKEKRQLVSSPMGKWLQLFLAGSSKRISISYDLLQARSNQTHRKKSEFKKTIDSALEELKTAKVIHGYRIKSNGVIDIQIDNGGIKTTDKE